MRWGRRFEEKGVVGECWDDGRLGMCKQLEKRRMQNIKHDSEQTAGKKKYIKKWKGTGDGEGGGGPKK